MTKATKFIREAAARTRASGVTSPRGPAWNPATPVAFAFSEEWPT